MAKTSGKIGANPSTELRINEKKWGKPLIDAGWTLLPNMLIVHQKGIGLDAIDINILLHLISYWWKPAELPHPAKGSIAEAMSLDPRTVQRRIARMEADGLISRQQRRGPSRGTQTNIYEFSGLITAATRLAKDHLAERAKKEAAKKIEAGRKGRGHLSVVSD